MHVMTPPSGFEYGLPPLPPAPVLPARPPPPAPATPPVPAPAPPALLASPFRGPPPSLPPLPPAPRLPLKPQLTSSTVETINSDDDARELNMFRAHLSAARNRALRRNHDVTKSASLR